MKMSSWIFLLISAMLIAGGLFLCNYARSIAPSDEAIDGSFTNEDGQSLTELDYSDLNVSTISLALEGCEVEIRGGAKDAKVELIGFGPNSFINSVSNKTLRISNQISLLDYFSFDGSGVSFSGVWQTLLSFTRENNTAEEPSVVIYIPDDFDINKFSISVTDCSVRVLNISGESDLSLYANKSTVEFNQVTSSMVDFECDESEISILNSTFTHFDIQSNESVLLVNTLTSEDITVVGDEGEFNLLKIDFKEFDLDMEKCTILLESIYTQGSYTRDIKVNDGEVYLGELLLGNEDESPKGETAPGVLIIKIEEGKVTNRYGSTQLVIEDENGNGEGETEDPGTEGENSPEPET